LGTWSLAGGSIHPFTNKLRDSFVAVERGHANGSMTVMEGGGAMRLGE
jgi:hypothetical protein